MAVDWVAISRLAQVEGRVDGTRSRDGSAPPPATPTLEDVRDGFQQMRAQIQDLKNRVTALELKLP